ncbi:MAG: hypothetical protein OXU74_06600 [Gemmatimonadota bacterium]|nr:hypothetical protein [Gemmatimonadota bacterium]
MRSYAQQAADLVTAGRDLQRAHQETRLPDKVARRAYELGFEDGLHGKPKDAEQRGPKAPDWKEGQWSPEHYREGYAFGALVRATARALHATCRPNKAHERPETPEPGRCHRPAHGPPVNGAPPGGFMYDAGERGAHVTTHSRVIMDLPESKDGGIVYRWWEGCIGCGAIRPVDEYRGGTVKWRAWRWPEGEGQQALAL